MMISQSSTVDFKAWFTCGVIGSPPTITVGIDQTTIHEFFLPIDYLEFSIPLDSGPHQLWIQYGYKDSTNESVINGIKQDTWIEIQNLSINGSMMNHLLNDCAYTEIDWQQHPDVADWFLINQGTVPVQLPKAKYQNLTSFYRFNFDLPLEHFLDHHLKIDPNWQHMYNAPLTRFQDLKLKLEKFSK